MAKTLLKEPKIIDPGATLPPEESSDIAFADTLLPESATDIAFGATLLPDSSSVSINQPSSRSGFPVDRWDRYEFIRLLGQGGMGAVYQARDKRLERTVALKFIRGGDPNLVMRFLQEARAQARIDHPHICKVYEVGEVDEKAYIAMQFVDGKSLDKASSTLSLTEKVLIMRQVAEAMHEAHRLGIIHRDLKPANIMIERLKDGSWNPIVMDFGLARESSESRGLTESGAVMGTPAYMAPEQARGDTRAVDRRSDVYSLGATLYDLVVGIPPFDAESVVEILLQVLGEEPKPLRERIASIPPDLETIVMKCLNKEPNQRYDSAKALAEDLDRYLNGEPIFGKRVSLMYRVKRRARKQRALVAVSIASFVVVLGFLGQALRQYQVTQREKARAEEETRLERDLAEQIKDMEWFLRTAYQLPLHDISEEQAIIRQRMAELPKPSPNLGNRGVGMIHYALARGYLALHESESSLKELRQAQSKGIDTQELQYALGRVLGDLFYQALEEARRQGDKSWLEGRQKELEKEYLQPALAALERSRGLKLASPEYLDGLIAFYRKQYDQALDKAHQAQKKARWWYESRQLEGDVLLARGTDQKDHGQYDEATKNLKDAIVAYQAAADIGRSDASIYEDIAEAFIQQAEIARNSGKPQDAILRDALTHAEHAIIAAPRHSEGYIKHAYAHFWISWGQLGSGQDPRLEVDKLINASQQALKENPRDAYAYDSMGNGYWVRGCYEADKGSNPLPSWEKATKALEQAITIAPRFPWAHNDLALVYASIGQYRSERGDNPTEVYLKSITTFDNAARIGADSAKSYSNMAMIYGKLARYSLEHGLDPQQFIDKSRNVIKTALSINENLFSTQTVVADLLMYKSQYSLSLFRDPSDSLAEAMLAVDAARKINPLDVNALRRLCQCIVISATHRHYNHINPTELIQRGLSAADECLKIYPNETECLVSRSKLLIIAADWAGQHKLPVQAHADLAINSASQALKVEPSNIDAIQELARALWLRAQSESIEKRHYDIMQALVNINNALVLNSNNGRSYAIRASLLLLQAQDAQNKRKGQSLAIDAKQGFEQALQINPLLKREYGRYAEEAAALAK